MFRTQLLLPLDGVNFYNDELVITVFGLKNCMDESIKSIYQQAFSTINVQIAYNRLVDHWFGFTYVDNKIIICEKIFYGDDGFN